MLARRHRILLEAQRLLDEAGVEGFTIRELSRRGKVAQRTLYNVFGSKEEIVASTIEERHKSLMANASRPPPVARSAVQLRELEATAGAVVNLRSYATALAAAFFSPTANTKIYDSLRRISVESSGNWLDRAEAGKIVRHLSEQEKERVLSLTVNSGYAVVIDWAAGRITDDELKRRFKINFLLCIYYVLRGPHRKEVDALLATLLNEELVAPVKKTK